MPAVASGGVSLVLGGRGFAGAHLVERLSRDGEVAAPSRAELDLTDADAVSAAVRSLRPAAVFHLAAFSSPRLSWEQPREAVVSNVEMTLNVLEAVRAEAPSATTVLVGSGQVYGTVESGPVTEDAPLDPPSPYAVSKVASDMLGAQYAAAHGMRVIRLRPFNHAGPGQSDEYVLATLARQVAEAEVAGAGEALLRTGDTSAARDFTDVRDVVEAYVLAAGAEPGVYNVCSGVSTTVAELIDLLRESATVAVRHEVDPGRLRAHDARAIWGSHDRLTAATGWRPRITLAQTVSDTLDWWRGRLS